MVEQRVLLSHLLNDKSTAPFSAVQAALSHHLAHLQPLPTPIAAAAVSAPFYLSGPHTYDKLQSLAAAFRNAVHLKLQLVEKAAESQTTLASVFSRDPQSAITQWTVNIVKGLQGGQAIMRLACLTGLLLGIVDIEKTKHDKGEAFNGGRGRNMVENELVIAVAEVVDAYAAEPKSDWEREFRPAVVDRALSLSLILASQCLPLVARTRLGTLPLSTLNGMLVSTISQAFRSGTFLSTLNESASSVGGSLRIPGEYGQNLKALTSSPAYMSIASLSKMTALTLEIMLDTRSRRIQQAMETAMRALSVFRQMARAIETDWSSSPLPGKKADDIELASRTISEDLWSVLKTFLFSTVMVAQAPVTTVIYAPQQRFLASSRPHHLALEVLHTLYHLSFIISEFGGISPESNSFTELKRITYLAHDILAQEPKDVEVFVRHICSGVGILGGGRRQVVNLHDQILSSKKAFALVCLEQLVPILGAESIRDWVWEMCYPHLSDASHRDLYESAHSVILAILASSAPPVNFEIRGTSNVNRVSDPNSANFVTRIIPFYAQCLLENSGDGKLSTPQLQLAYSALVQSAANHNDTNDGMDPAALAWYCIEVIIDAVRELSNNTIPATVDSMTTSPATESHLHHLHLTLIATVHSLPLPLMLRALDEIRDIILEKDTFPRRIEHHDLSKVGASTNEGSGAALGPQGELVNALFREILEHVGDREKEAAMGWWYANLAELTGAVRDGDGVQYSSDRGLSGK